MLKFEIDVHSEDLLELRDMDEQLKRGLKNGLEKVALKMEADVKKSFSKSHTPKVRTGTLKRSIESGTRLDRAWVGSNLVYAAIQELGGVITPRTAEYLTFQIGNQWVKVRTVTIPARPYIEPTIKKEIGKYTEIIQDEIAKEMSR